MYISGNNSNCIKKYYFIVCRHSNLQDMAIIIFIKSYNLKKKFKQVSDLVKSLCVDCLKVVSKPTHSSLYLNMIHHTCWVTIFNIRRAIGPWSDGICDDVMDRDGHIHSWSLKINTEKCIFPSEKLS